MQNNKKIIFISTFIIVLLISIGLYLWINKDTKTQTGETPWYQSFNPFSTGTDVTNTTKDENGNIIDENGNIITEVNQGNSKFQKITDFAIAGASLFEEERPITGEEIETPKEPEEIKTIINPNTKEGKKDIQIFLNNALSLNPALVTDGVFGKKVTQAIKDFQKLNNLKITGIVDAETAPYFVKITKSENVATSKSQVEQAPTIRYVERKNGHIYRMFLDTNIKEKISNTTIPNIYEAIFGGNGKTVLYRYLSEDNTINSFMATTGAPTGKMLPQNISDASISQDKTNIFYLTENATGVVGTTESVDGTRRNIVFNHPFTEWLSQWDNKQNIYLTTKSSYGVSGSIFSLNQMKKTITKIFGDTAGLTTLVSPDGNSILYSYTTKEGPKIGIFNIKEHTTKDLNVFGLAEKCVWSKDNINVYCGVPSVIDSYELPDLWYQGLVSFDDFFVSINTATGDKYTIADSTKETPIDATYLFLNKEESSLFFTNKKDSTLWSLKIK